MQKKCGMNLKSKIFHFMDLGDGTTCLLTDYHLPVHDTKEWKNWYLANEKQRHKLLEIRDEQLELEYKKLKLLLRQNRIPTIENIFKIKFKDKVKEVLFAAGYKEDYIPIGP